MSLIPWRRQALAPWFDWERMMEGFEEPFGLTTPREGRWWPAVDIDEDEKAITVAADLPDMDRKDINVALENGYLTIRGERKVEKKEENKKYRRMERSYGAFERSFTLPDNVDDKKISADYKNGVLKVTLPKTKPAVAEGQKTIEVK
jgi:HSP20 family protein